MKAFLLLMTSCFVFATSSAQSLQDCQSRGKHTAVIQGRVTNKHGEPEAGVKVKVTDHGCYKGFATTDAYGTYKLTLKDGTYDVIIVYKSGVQDRTGDIKLHDGEKLVIDLSERMIRDKRPLEVLEVDEERAN